jgi:iron complex outermembrane receptor protein
MRGGALTQNGMQTHRGLELNAFGLLARDTRVLGGVLLLRAQQTHTPDGVNQGKNAVGTARAQASLALERDNVLARG